MRLFFGIELDERSRRVAANRIEAVRRRVSGRFVSVENLHMTVRYIGEVGYDSIDAIKSIGREAANRSDAVVLTLNDAGYFGKSSDAIVYLGVEGASDLSLLSDYICQELVKRGLPCDPKSFKPHITIARKVCVSDGILDMTNPEAVSWAADGLTLFDSARIDGHLTYTPIARWRFNKNQREYAH